MQLGNVGLNSGPGLILYPYCVNTDSEDSGRSEYSTHLLFHNALCAVQ